MTHFIDQHFCTKMSIKRSRGNNLWVILDDYFLINFHVKIAVTVYVSNSERTLSSNLGGSNCGCNMALLWHDLHQITFMHYHYRDNQIYNKFDLYVKLWIHATGYNKPREKQIKPNINLCQALKKCSVTFTVSTTPTSLCH